jgi:hypothetical protein
MVRVISGQLAWGSMHTDVFASYAQQCHDFDPIGLLQ